MMSDQDNNSMHEDFFINSHMEDNDHDENYYRILNAYDVSPR